MCSEIHKDVVIIGNGPSAITLSYILSGNWPYYKTAQAHPNQFLHERLVDEEVKDKSLIEQDLEQLSNGLEGRSINPVSVLFDQLQHPEADFGIESPSTLSWKFNQNKSIDHVVIGKGLPGGAWHKMDDCKKTLTISIGSWMELPNMPIWEWCQDHKRSESRVNLSTVANYYKDYVFHQQLASYFQNFSTVTSVNYDANEQDCYKVEGFNSSTGPFKYSTPNLVLATGNSDQPNRLNVCGENLPFVLHSLNQLEHLLSQDRLNQWSDPILVVGAGLSAADAIIAIQFKRIPVVHAFRRHPDDPALIFNQLPENMYPEYHKVHSKMRRKKLLQLDGYEPLTMHCVKKIRNNKEVVLSNIVGAADADLITYKKIKVSYVLVLIGMKPDLGFLKPQSMLLNLGTRQNQSIDTRSNPINIDSFSHESNILPGLFAMGPLVGDNFVRFVQGGALAIANCLWSRKLNTSF